MSYIKPTIVTAYGTPMKILPHIDNMLNEHMDFKKEAHQRLRWKYLSQNSSAIDILEMEYYNINWEYIGANSSAIHLMYNYQYCYHSCCNNLLDWWYITNNPYAISLLLKNPGKIKWDILYANPNAINIIEFYFFFKREDVNWYYLSSNPSAIRILKHNFNKIVWESFSKNSAPEAIDILLDNPGKINWNMFSLNTSPKAMSYLENNIEKINWHNLSQNPSAIYILQKNSKNITWNVLTNIAAIHLIEDKIRMFPKKIDPRILSVVYSNPCIFVYDYQKMKKNMDILREDLIKKTIHPRRVNNWIYNENEDMLE